MYPFPQIKEEFTEFFCFTVNRASDQKKQFIGSVYGLTMDLGARELKRVLVEASASKECPSDTSIIYCSEPAVNYR